MMSTSTHAQSHPEGDAGRTAAVALPPRALGAGLDGPAVVQPGADSHAPAVRLRISSRALNLARSLEESDDQNP